MVSLEVRRAGDAAASRRHDRSVWLAIYALVAATACFQPSYDEPLCSAAQTCPGELVCHPDGICRSNGTPIDAAAVDAPDDDGAAIDATDGDAPATDASTIDARPLDASPTDASIDGMAPPVVVAYLAPADAFVGTGDLTVGTTTLNTDSLTFTPTITLPPGASLTAVLQQAGTSVAVLHVRDLTINGVLSVRGSRPLAIVAGGTVRIIGTIDAAADLARPGAGGFTMGPTAGGAGLINGSNDSGGGGGGNGRVGGRGGNVAGVGPIGGAAGGQIGPGTTTELRGGSGGGAGARTCVPAATGGAGGGAVLVYAATAISVTGTISAGGGAGNSGENCTGTNGGSGGGSGGHIDLQSPSIVGGGRLAANGGSGSGAAGSSGGGSGDPGENARLDMTPAIGGTGGTGSPPGTSGGNGAAGVTEATNGGDLPTNGNTGGGGGGAGVIVLRYHPALPPSDAVTTSPLPRRTVY